MITRECPHCKNTYLADPKRLKHGRQTSCSRECSYALRGNNLERNESKTCDICNKVYFRKPAQHRAKNVSVCSLPCYMEARKQGLVTPRPPTKPTFEFVCELCSERVVLPSSKKGARRFRFCSYECATKWHRGENHTHWRGGHDDYYGENWDEQRQKARVRDNHTCQDCGITKAEKGREMDVHHIIRFAEFDDYKKANHIDNLISLCHICHMKAEWEDYPAIRLRK